MFKVKRFMFWNNRAVELQGYADFSVDFIEWSKKEYGIAICRKYDGKLIPIPEFALEGFNPAKYPIQDINLKKEY